MTATFANGATLDFTSFTFDGAGKFPVLQETGPGAAMPYGNAWNDGPQGYAAGQAIVLNNVILTAGGAAVAARDVRLQANVELLNNGTVLNKLFGTVDFTIPVNAAGDLAPVNINLGYMPSQVMYVTDMRINWQVYDLTNNAGWYAVDTTNSREIYVTAALPVPTTSYFLNWNNNLVQPARSWRSLLNMSCQAAQGLTSTNLPAVQKAIYDMFKSPNPNNRVYRLNAAGMREPLQYWGQPAMYNVGQSLIGNRGPATVFNVPVAVTGFAHISCCAWADILITMWALHGYGAARLVQVETNIPNSTFLVRNWDFNNHQNLSSGSFTHDVECRQYPVFGDGDNIAKKLEGAPGQNNPNPPPSFRNHYIVKHSHADDLYFDPSYGSDPCDQNQWKENALAGLQKYTYVNGQVQRQQVGYTSDANKVPNRIRMADNAVRLTDVATGAIMP